MSLRGKKNVTSLPTCLASWALALAILILAFAFTGTLALTGCASTENNSAQADQDSSSQIKMRHSLKEIYEYDSFRMAGLVDSELNMHEADEDLFLNDAANILAQTILIQPNYAERTAAIKELKNKLEPEAFTSVMQNAGEILLRFAQKSQRPSDQATALVGLKNFVNEARLSKKPEYKGIVQKIADAHLEVSDQAKTYARNPMQQLSSPSVEAEAIAKTL